MNVESLVVDESTLVLGIETSCDETAAALVLGGYDVVSSVVSTQVDLHAAFGGVVPEIASRAHTERITLVIERALQAAGVTAATATSSIDRKNSNNGSATASAGGRATPWWSSRRTSTRRPSLAVVAPNWSSPSASAGWKTATCSTDSTWSMRYCLRFVFG